MLETKNLKILKKHKG